MSVEIEVAESLPHALELLSPADPLIRPVAGATDLILRLHGGRLTARRLVSIADLPELSFITAEPDALCVGAGTAISDLLSHAEVRAELPAAVQSAREFASPQIRNRATLGGNLGNASPAADLIPPLISFGATVTLRSWRGTRQLPVEDLFLGMGKTAVAPDELITVIRIPRRKGYFQAFAKFGSRSANIISVVNAALCLKLEDDRIAEARVAYGSVAPKPLRAAQVEAALLGRTLNEALVDEMAAIVPLDAKPIDDVRGTRRYKLHLAVTATQDALSRALATLREGH
jgi:carbon-monoxide dehydrogenase medium subunit